MRPLPLRPSWRYLLLLPLLLLGWLGGLGYLLAAPPDSDTSAAFLSQPRSALDPATAARREAACTRCHDALEAKPILSLAQTAHGARHDPRTPLCQSCHGDSTAHLKAGQRLQRPATDQPYRILPGKTAAPATAEAANRACLGCHAGRDQGGAASAHVAGWPGSRHAQQGLACTSCHTIHTPHDPALQPASEVGVCTTCHRREGAQLLRPSAHPLHAGRMGCSDCHDAHGNGNGPRLLREASSQAQCTSCHADQRGPFLWEHAPASDDCLNCHQPHGSANGSLLKLRSPQLCQQCHAASRHPGNVYSGANLPGGSVANVNRSNPNNPSVQLPLRGCSNCHSRIHGSNHPAGAYFLR